MDVILDTGDRSVRYLAVAVEGKPKPVPAPPDWIRRADWEEGVLVFDLSREGFRGDVPHLETGEREDA